VKEYLRTKKAICLIDITTLSWIKFLFCLFPFFSILSIYTISFTDLDILHLLKICNGGLVLGLKPVSATTIAASKIYAPSKKGQN
jgi:hypothetical protein